MKLLRLYSAIGVLVIFARCNVSNDSHLYVPQPSLLDSIKIFSILASEVAEFSFIWVVFTYKL